MTFLLYLAAGVINIEMAIKKCSIRGLNRFFIIFLCEEAPGTRPEAPGTPVIDSTSLEGMFLRVYIFPSFLTAPS